VAVAKKTSPAKKATKPHRAFLAFDTEATGLDLIHGCKPFYVSTCDSRGEIECWQWPVDPFTREPQIPDLEKLDIKLLFTGPKLVGHNAKFDVRALSTIGIGLDFNNIEDTMLISHAVNSAEPHGLKALCKKYLWIDNNDETELQKAVNRSRAIGRKLGFRVAEEGDPHFPALKFGDEEKAAWRSDMWLPRAVAVHQKYPKGHPWYSVCSRYAQWDAVRTMRLFLAYREFEEHARQNDSELYHSIQQYRTLNYPCVQTTYEMEVEGVPVSRSRIKYMTKLAGDEARDRTARMKKLFPGVNFNSPKQLGEVLYKRLGLPILKRTETGEPGTDKKTLVRLALAVKLHTDSAKLLSEKELQAAKEVKLIGPFKSIVHKADEFLTHLLTKKKVEKLADALYGYSDHICFDSGIARLHGQYRDTGTRLTRMSGENPNNQNVAKDDDGDNVVHINEFIKSLGINPRAIFVPPSNELWFAADGNQLQLRIFAAVSGDRNLIAAFENNEKLHNYVARRIFKLKESDPVSDAQKRVAKGCNFGSIFGATDNKIDETAGIEGISKLYAELFPDAKGFMRDTMERAARDGYVTTPGGYRLVVDAIHAGVNYIVSGCEGEIMKRAMTACHHYLKSITRPAVQELCGFSGGTTGRVLMQIHDELLFAFKPRVNPAKNRKKAIAECMPHLSMLKFQMEGAGRRLGITTPMEFKIIETSWADGTNIEIPDVTVQAEKWKDSLDWKTAPVEYIR
jgi:DNA polymerase I-like protein with 3'-5' exonuclease and polymerase domains